MDCGKKFELTASLPEAGALPSGFCPVDQAGQLLRQAAEESCGETVFCRDGLVQMLTIVRDIAEGKSAADDIALLREICETVRRLPGCSLTDGVTAYLLGSLDRYAEEWEAHSRRRRCSQMVCSRYYGLYIDPVCCQGCGRCIQAAPKGAVIGGEGLVSVIVDDENIKNEAFLAVCRNHAIKKYSGMRPRIPETPQPVGSAAKKAEAGTRRRRRG